MALRKGQEWKAPIQMSFLQEDYVLPSDKSQPLQYGDDNNPGLLIKEGLGPTKWYTMLSNLNPLNV